jgi:hypothetical protein
MTAREGQYPLEIRAQCVAAVMAGGGVGEVAKRYGLQKTTVSRWVKDVRFPRPHPEDAPEPEFLENLIFDLVSQQILAIRTQLQAASRPDWLARQTAGELAHLLVAERDTLIRLLAGFRPVTAAQLPLDNTVALAELPPTSPPDPTSG